MNKRKKAERKVLRRRIREGEVVASRNKMAYGQSHNVHCIGTMDRKVGEWLSSPKLIPRISPALQRQPRKAA